VQSLIALWSRLDPRRQIIALLAAATVAATLITMARMAATPELTLLYSGLDGAAAGEVVKALEGRAVAHEVRGNAIYVDASARDSLRMALAAEGLPANGAAGYELLDSLSGFGTTSQMFDAAYWRAKEGELARTILANPQIRAARVHIANTSGQPFRRNLTPSASVTVTMGSGTLSPVQARALKFLVASSVAGLQAEDVSVIDSGAGLIATGEAVPAAAGGDDRSEMLRRNVERLLEARMGPGKAVVEVSVETVTDRESIVERRFDPDSRVAISTDTEERTTSAADQGGSAVTVASNLPEGDGAAERSSSSSNSETRERVNFEVSETQREIVRGPGAVKRLTVAVLLDGVRSVDASGAEVWSPLPEEQLTALEELVASTVGFDADRGDVITIKSMPFEPPTPAGTLIEAGLLDRLALDVMSLAQLTILGIVGLLLGLFVLRPVLTGRSAQAIPASLRAPEGAVAAIPEAAARTGNTENTGLTGEIDDGPLPEFASETEAENPRTGAAGAGLALPQTDPVERLRSLITDRREESIEILRHWMEDEDEEPV